MAVTVYELKEKMASIGAQLAADKEWITEKAANPEIPMEEIEAKKKHRDELKKRFDMLKEQCDEIEQEAVSSFKAKHVAESNPKEKALLAKGEYYKAALTNGDVKKTAEEVKKAFQGLGAIPAQDPDLGYGDSLLPVNMASELLTEPLETNSLRNREPVSNVTGLIEPIFEIEIDDTALADVTDKDTAKEIETKGNEIKYGRYKTALSVTVKNTVLHGSPYNLATTIDNGLRSGLAIKEKMRAFATSPDAEHAHMSFYSDENAIKVVTGDTQYDAITQAWADLPDDFAQNAAVYIRKTDYVKMIKELANGSDALWGKKPEDILGIPVEFNDRAVYPVVGDFRYSKQNYDIGTTYETDMDARKGEYYFVLTAWGDHRIKLSSAFRIAKVNP